MPDFQIRVMRRDELDLAIEWAGNEGWNPGLNDAHCYYQADPQGFLIGELDGIQIACISAMKYSNDFGFIGFYIIEPDYRGQGYGVQIWQAAVNYLSGCNIGLDGVVTQQANYKKSGFKLAYANVRYQGVVEILNERVGFNKNECSNNQIKPLNQLPFEQVAEFEGDFFPTARHAFLRQWVAQTNSLAFAYVNDGELLGYGVMRQCLEGYKVAPLFANTLAVATDLMAALIANLPVGSEYFLDVPECQHNAVLLTKTFSMDAVFETARMYTKEVPSIALNRTYGVTSFEIG